MNIDEVKTAIKIGHFILKEDSHNKIDIVYEADKKVLNENTPRVYLFVVNGLIKKIGGSISKGGIKSTISFYVNAMTGSPGPVRFIIHLLIEQELKKGSNVDVYMITSPKIMTKVPGLFGYKDIEISSFKEMENFCKADYYYVENKYPDWNFQENNREYPKELYDLYLKYHEDRLSRK